MSYYLWEMRPYFRQVAGQMVLGSLAGIMMNTAVVLPYWSWRLPGGTGKLTDPSKSSMVGEGYFPRSW